MNFKNKIITVVGLAKSGQAAARLASEGGAHVRVTEGCQADAVSSKFREWMNKKGIVQEFGGHTPDFIKGSDFVVLSPGVRLDTLVVQWAIEQKIPVIGELEFAYYFCPCPIVAVTGSNGKTTVTTLIGRVLREGDKKVFVGGNIGTPFSDEVLDLTPEHIAVLEVSSFQLETIKHFRPYVAVFINISQNHLDRHADMDEYLNYKMRIFENQTQGDFAVLNACDERIVTASNRVPSKVQWFNGDDQKKQTGYRNPNFLAVDMVASVFGVHPDFCKKVFSEFVGLEHRMEIVRRVNDIVFINDSKSTTTEATRWALTQFNQPVVWICGGRDKNLDFSVLREIVKEKVRAVVAIGEAAGKVKSCFSDLVNVVCPADFKGAVKQAHALAHSADAVLLSPMCASFDMFDNFEHRGQEFKRIVKEL